MANSRQFFRCLTSTDNQAENVYLARGGTTEKTKKSSLIVLKLSNRWFSMDIKWHSEHLRPYLYTSSLGFISTTMQKL